MNKVPVTANAARQSRLLEVMVCFTAFAMTAAFNSSLAPSMLVTEHPPGACNTLLMSATSLSASPRPQHFFIAATLSLVSVYLTFSGHGYIILPTSGSWITIIHLPTILAGILGGWWVGALVGGVFGLSAMVYAAQSDVAVFADVWVSLPPRIVVGLVAGAVFSRSVRWGEHVAVLAAAVAGTLTNTVLVLSTAVWRGYFSADVAINVATKHFVLEVSVAAIGTLLLTLVWRALQVALGKVRQADA